MSSDHIEDGRRAVLKLSPFALAAVANSIGRIALAEAPTPTTAEAFFNARNFGATGHGKTVDTPAINRAIEATIDSVRPKLNIGCQLTVFPWLARREPQSSAFRILGESELRTVSLFWGRLPVASVS